MSNVPITTLIIIKNIGNKKDTEKKLYDAIEMACDLDSDRDMIKAKIDDILEEYDENAEFTAFDVLNDAQEHFEEMGLGIGASMKLLKFAAKYPLLQIKIMKIIMAPQSGGCFWRMAPHTVSHEAA